MIIKDFTIKCLTIFVFAFIFMNYCYPKYEFVNDNLKGSCTFRITFEK